MYRPMLHNKTFFTKDKLKPDLKKRKNFAFYSSFRKYLNHIKMISSLAAFNLVHLSAHAADGDMILKDVFTKLEKTLTGGGFRLATLAGGIGGIVVAGYKGNWPVAGLCLGLAVTAHAFVDWVKASYTYLI